MNPPIVLPNWVRIKTNVFAMLSHFSWNAVALNPCFEALNSSFILEGLFRTIFKYYVSLSMFPFFSRTLESSLFYDLNDELGEHYCWYSYSSYCIFLSFEPYISKQILSLILLFSTSNYRALHISKTYCPLIIVYFSESYIFLIISIIYALRLPNP